MRQTKRTYRDVAIVEREEGFVILLDDRPSNTLQEAILSLPSRTLANAIAAEWRDQVEQVDRATMPLTGLANSALDRVNRHRGQVIDHILGFGRSDLLYYRAQEPAALVARQKKLWDPLLDRARAKHGLRLVADAGIGYIEQPVDAILRMREIAAALDDFRLAAFDLSATLTGSFVIALALVEGHLPAEEAFAAAQLDEIYQAEKWGRDAEAEVRREHLLVELRSAERFVSLLTT